MIRLALSTLATALVLQACGTSEPAEAKKVNSAGLTGDVPCKDDDCPPIVMSITANPMQNGVLTGNTSTMEPFIITGSSQGGGSRDIRMMAFNPPKGGDFTGQGTLSIQASYNSIEAVTSQANIDVVIRDVSRCRLEAPGAQCENLQATGLEAFEARQSFGWQIVEGDINQFTDPTFTSQQAPMTGANAGMKGCTQGFFQGAVGGLMGGSILPAVLGGAMGCIGTSFGNLGK